MAYIQVPPDQAGKKVEARTVTAGPDTVYRQTVELGDVIVTASGELPVFERNSAAMLARLANIEAGQDSITVTGALPAGPNNIGDVDVLTLPPLPAGDNNIGNVDLASPLPAGDNNIGNVDVLTMPLTAVALATYAERVRQDGAVAHWRLGEASGTTAVDVVGGNNGTISGGVTLGQAGVLSDGDTAMTVDGTSGQIVTSQSVTIPVTCTVEAWIRGTYGVNRPILVLSGQAPLFSIDPAHKLYVYDGASFGGLTGNRVLTDAVWYHVVFVLDGSSGTFYVNGVLDRTLPGVRTTPQTAIAGIGYDGAFAAGDPRNHWNGDLDEVAIYPTALTATQIAAHYDLRMASLPPGDNNIGNVDIASGPTGTSALQMQGTTGDDEIAYGYPIRIAGKDTGGYTRTVQADAAGVVSMQLAYPGQVHGTVGDGIAVSGNPVRIGAKDGGGLTQDLTCDSAGVLAVNVASSLPAGPNNIGDVDIASGPTAAAALQFQGNVIHGALEPDGIRVPVLTGATAQPWGESATAVATGTRVSLMASRIGQLITLGGHSNSYSYEYNGTTANADRPIFFGAIPPAYRVIVTMLTVSIKGTAAADSYVRIGFGTTTLPAVGVDGGDPVFGMLLTQWGLKAGSTVTLGNGGGIIGIGGPDQELRASHGADVVILTTGFLVEA